MKRLHVFYSGNVQGVGFRFTAIDCARQNQVTGWARNTTTGGVEVIAEGSETSLNKFISQLDRSMAHYIGEKKFSWEPATGEFSEFGIQY